MTDSPPQNKKLRLTWEHPADPVPVDITEKGESIFAPVPTLSERLSSHVLRLWQERSFANLDDTGLHSEPTVTSNAEPEPVSNASRPSSPGKPVDALSKMKPGDTIPQRKPPGHIIHEMKTNIFNSVRNAQGEIGVALDVVNILLASTRPDVPSQFPLMLPVTGLATTYINRPRASLKVQLEAARLNLAGKKKQLHAAADILAGGANGLRDVLEKEHIFWEEALAIRNRNWTIQARLSPGMSAAFFVNYGLSDAGSTFREHGIAQVARDTHAQRSQRDMGGNNTDTAMIRLTLSHQIPRELRLKIIETPGATTCDRLHQKDDKWLWWDVYSANWNLGTLNTDQSRETAVARIERDLLSAQSTLFESELFSEIVKEARTQMGGIRLIENHIRVEVDEARDVVLEWAPAQENLALSDTHITLSENESTLLAVKLSMQLMLRRRHREAAAVRKGAIHPDLRRRNLTPSPLIGNLLNSLQYRRLCEKVLHAVDRIMRPLSQRGLRLSVHLIPTANAKEMAEHNENWERVGHVLILKLDGCHICKLNLRPPFTMEMETANVTLSVLDMEDLERLLTREVLGHCLRRICNEANKLGVGSTGFIPNSDSCEVVNSSCAAFQKTTGFDLGPSNDWKVCEDGNKISAWIRVLRENRSICRPIKITAETTRGSTSSPVYRILFYVPASKDHESVSEVLELRDYQSSNSDENVSGGMYGDEIRRVLVSLMKHA